MEYYVVPKQHYPPTRREENENFPTLKAAIEHIERRFQEDNRVWGMTIYIVVWDFEPVIVKVMRFADIRQFPLIENSTPTVSTATESTEAA